MKVHCITLFYKYNKISSIIRRLFTHNLKKYFICLLKDRMIIKRFKNNSLRKICLKKGQVLLLLIF